MFHIVACCHVLADVIARNNSEVERGAYAYADSKGTMFGVLHEHHAKTQEGAGQPERIVACLVDEGEGDEQEQNF